MSSDLAKFVVVAREATDARLTATSRDKAQQALTKVAIDPLLVAMDLETARTVRDANNKAVFDHLLGKMTLAQLKKASKKWNPKRAPIPREMGMTDLRKELIALLDGAAPATAAPRARATRARAR